jgi:hypothetical protein
MDDYPFDLGTYARPITTTSPAAQRWFDRGLNWVFAYNHEEAALCFDRALEHDPGCAMAHWGLAYVAGPNYNRPWELFGDDEILETLRLSRESCHRAQDNAAGVSPVERALIDALQTRYQSEVPASDLYVWSAEYSDAMRAVHRQFDDDPDVACLFAEAMMNRTPWQMWELRSGLPTSAIRIPGCGTSTST